MKRYAVIDLQGMDFMSYTHEKPITREEIIEHFQYLDYNEGIGINPKTLKTIKEIWGIDLKVIK